MLNVFLFIFLVIPLMGLTQHDEMSPNITMSATKFTPDTKKYAYIRLEVAPDLILEKNIEFYVVQAKTKKVVFSGPVDASIENPDFYEIDISEISQPGEYYLSIPNVGRSEVWTIQEEDLDLAVPPLEKADSQDWLDIKKYIAHPSKNAPSVSRNVLNTLRSPFAVALGYAAYPKAAATLLGYVDLDTVLRHIERLEKKGYIVREITIVATSSSFGGYKISYHGVIVTKASTRDNGNWCIHAFGNGMSIEDGLLGTVKEAPSDCNLLFVNGPSVGKSQGWPTRFQLGAGFEAGLQFLEEKVGAKKILMKGHSLGGGMMSEAILQHKFVEGVQYMSISDRTFSRLSDVVGALVSPVVAVVFRIAGADLDNIEASKKLSHLGIPHVIIQHVNGKKDTDGVIPDNVSLSNALHEEGTLENKIFLESSKITHNGALPDKSQEELTRILEDFFSQREK